jgi:hypothetical protein
MQRLFGSIGAAAAIALCACSQKEAAKPDSAPVAQAGAAASRASYDPATHVAVVHAKDFSFEAPDSVGAGWTTFHLVNDGPAIHHMQLVRIDSGKTVQDVVTAMDALIKRQGPPAAWLTLVSGPNAPNPGGAESDATINLERGNYALICLVDIPSHVAHFEKGMVRALKVTAASGVAAAEPTADVTLALSDYKFEPTGPLTTAGTHTFKVTNAGPQPHEVEIIRFAPGKTMKDVGEFMAAAMGPNPPAGPPPGDLIGGLSAGQAKQVAYFTANLTPGNYVMLCFISDAKDGKMHVEHGMVREFEVK